MMFKNTILTSLVILISFSLSMQAVAQQAGDYSSFSFTNDVKTFEQNFNDYRGTAATLPAFMMVTWDDRIDDPFTGVGDFDTSDPETSYGGFTAYTSGSGDYSFGIREREPVNLRDARLFFSFTNNTDEPISVFEVSYDVEAWFIGDRRNRIRLKFDTMLESDDRDTFEVDLISTDNPSSVETPNTKVNGALEENRVSVSEIIDITTINDGTGEFFEALQPGETAYFRWQFSNLAAGESGSLRSGLAINNVAVNVVEEDIPNPVQPRFSFTNDNKTYEENFNDYRGSEETLNEFLFVDWDETRIANPFTGVGDFETSDVETSYGGFTAYTSGGGDYSFGIRERVPVDLRDSRLFFAFTNDTDEPISVFEVSYDVEAWFIGDRRNRLRLKFDTEIESETRDTFEEDIFSTDNPSSEQTPGTKVNGALEENRVNVSGLVDITTLVKDDDTGETFEPLQPGETAYFRWQFSNTDGDGGSLRSGLAINNLVISVFDGDTSIETGAGLPESFVLRQNYPNPFNPATQISFTLPQTTDISLNVYNIQGQRVATLAQGTTQAGTHHISFDASNLASGVYVYRLQAGNEVRVKKMTLIK